MYLSDSDLLVSIWGVALGISIVVLLSWFFFLGFLLVDRYSVDRVVSLAFGGHTAWVLLLFSPHSVGVFPHLRFGYYVVLFISSEWLVWGLFHTRGIWVDGFFSWLVREGQRFFFAIASAARALCTYSINKAHHKKKKKKKVNDFGFFTQSFKLLSLQ